LRTVVKPRQILAAFVVLAPTILLSGCGSNADLAMVQALASMTTQAAEQFPNIANDLYGSCVRAAYYQPIQLNATLSPDATHASPDQSSARTIFERRSHALQECESRRQIGDELISTNAVLLNYIATLGQLATNETVNFNSIDSLQAVLQNSPSQLARAIGTAQLPRIPGIQNSRIGVLTALQGALRTFENRSRLSTIRGVIIASDDQLGVMIENLTEAIDQGYLGYLTDEENSLDRYYRTYTAGLLANRTEGDTQSLTMTVMGLDTQWRNDREVVRQRRQAASSYVELLHQIAVEHHQLQVRFDQGETPNAAEMNQIIQSYEATVNEVLHAFQSIQEQQKSR
jgi:hypothetical protein